MNQLGKPCKTEQKILLALSEEEARELSFTLGLRGENLEEWIREEGSDRKTHKKELKINKRIASKLEKARASAQEGD